ncbi:MAG: hypothetical protein H8Z69_02125 [Nanohaloarchaea archaeon]|nr:hypothetical protein [Candidatus Nanohaloarchaea archaeon]
MGDKYFDLDRDELLEMLDFLEEDVENVRRVAKFIEEKDIDAEFLFHGKSESAKDSAEKTDLDLDQIVKTLVFKTGNDFVAVLCPGDSRVSEQSLEDLTGSKVRMAKPSEVENHTGYIVGGVSPFDLDIDVFMDISIPEKDLVRPAAGSRVVGVELEPEELVRALNPSIEDICR